MTATQTSIENYRVHRDSGELGHQCKALLAAMVPGYAYSRAELAERSRIRLSSVCGRVHEMIAGAALTEGPKRRCRVTGRTVGTVIRPLESDQMRLL